jgi:hypothetical protein
MENIENKKRATSVALVWILTKLTQPLRIAITIAVTYYLIKTFKQK